MRELEHLAEVERQLGPRPDRGPAARMRQRFRMILANVFSADIYWSPSRHGLISRATSRTRKFEVPRDAVFVGTYSHPSNANDFLDDLDDVLAKLANRSAACTATACSG
jgi:hypothetical protein